ncbi:MAG: EamA family transporter [Verrucomicrobia bacterium]|nr:EamA family transporter [Verrucomicrobiota bacterium]
MTSFALLLVLVAAVLHATWNYFAKRAGGGLPFVYLIGVMICALYVPVLSIYWLTHEPVLPPGAGWWIIGSGVLKTSYSLFLQRGYRTGDFSLIYPLARGTGPLLSTLGAIALLGERPSWLAIAGGAVIIVSIFFLANGAKLFHEDHAHLRNAVKYGILSGIFIASYTLWDRRGVAILAIVPLLYDAGTAYTQLALLTPFAWRRRAEVRVELRERWRLALGVAVLSPVAYILVLTAMTFTPVSYVAPAREVSIVFGAFIGAKLLKETDSRKRIIAAAFMAAGIMALALG